MENIFVFLHILWTNIHTLFTMNIFVLCGIFYEQTYVHYLQWISLSYMEEQLGRETSALGAKWKSQLYVFPPTMSEHSLEFSWLGMGLKESSSSGGRDESHLYSLPPVAWVWNQLISSTICTFEFGGLIKFHSYFLLPPLKKECQVSHGLQTLGIPAVL